MADFPFTLEPETPGDEEAIQRLNERVFGPGRFARTA
jgi:predicted N-acetyltransferase YhbS